MMDVFAMGKKKTKPKKSKAQKIAERLKVEEEERKAEILRAEIEAERIRQEAEDARRLKEQQIAERTEELERLATELQESEDEIAAIAERLRRLERLEARQVSWDNYTKCDPRPDASSEKALNTFLSEGFDEEVTDLQQAMERCGLAESVAIDLHHDMGKALEDGNMSKMARNLEFLHKLRDLSLNKIDFATAHLLSHWDLFSRGDEEIDRTCTTASGIRFGIWVNTTLKGFRIKTVDFAMAGMSTDIPRSLSGASVAVRSLFLPYHFVRRGTEVAGAGGGQGTSSATGLLAVDEAIHEYAGTLTGMLTLEGSSSFRRLKNAPSPETQDNNMMVLGGTYLLEILALPPVIKKIKGWVFRAETELTKKVSIQTYPLDGGNAALAPVLRVQFAIPPGVIVPLEPEVRAWDPKAAAWTSDGIEEYEWQPTKRVVRLHTTRVGAIAIVQDRACDLAYASWRLTPIYDPDPLTASVEGIDDGEMLRGDPVPEAELELETPRFIVRIRIRGTKCRLLAPEVPELKAFLDAPGMRPGHLIMELERAGLCLSPRNGDADKAAFVDGKEVAASSGDGEDDPHTSKAGVILKSRELEEVLCREVAKASAAFEMRSSKWNRGVGDGRAVFEVRETGAFTGGGEDFIAFKTVLMELDEVSDSRRNAPDLGDSPCLVKCSLVNGGNGEVGNGFDSGKLPGEKTHPYLLKCLAMSSSPEALERARESCCRFQKAVEQLLRITRPFSFS